MEWFYPASCIAAFIVCVILGFLTRPKADSSAGAPDGFRAFQMKYLCAWSVCVCADWLQGPYVYALYEAYGYSRQDNARLFVAGFGASFVFGTFVAGIADSMGRKRAVLLYCFFYIVSCLTKHFNDYHVLMLGRITGGIATSLLFSAFESWLVYEHSTRHNFPPKLLSYSFSMMYFVNYLVAVSCGLSADVFVNAVPLTAVGGGVFHYGQYLMAFDMAIVALLIGGAYVAFAWDENFGDSNGAVEALKDFGRSAVLIVTSVRMGLCCAVIALFESSMYIFVFNWTPVLHQGATPPPFGMIFSTFMMCCMIGSSIFALCTRVRTSAVLFATLLLGACGMLVPTRLGMSEALVRWNLWAFLAFELCCGIYFPAICTLKSESVPEAHRSTIYNLFRAPMNAIVISVLLVNPSLEATFKFISCQLTLGAGILGFLIMSSGAKGCEEAILKDGDGMLPISMKGQ